MNIRICGIELRVIFSAILLPHLPAPRAAELETNLKFYNHGQGLFSIASNRFLNENALVGAFDKEKALVGAFTAFINHQTSRRFVYSSAARGAGR